MGFLEEMQSVLGPAVGSTYADLLGIVRNSPRETSSEAIASMIRAQDLLGCSSFTFKDQQNSTSEGRYAGEGAETNTLAIGNVTLNSSIKMPLYIPAHGWVDPAFASLWYLAKLAYWGSATASEGAIVSSVGSGVSSIITNNISDFLSIPTPFALDIIPIAGETAESVTVSSVTKHTRTIHLSGVTAYSHSAGTLIASRPSISGGATADPSFSLMSLREGLLAPSLVNKITIDAKAGASVNIEAEISSLMIDRNAQIGLRSSFQSLVSSYANKSPVRVLNGSHVQVGMLNGNSGTFGLSTALGDPIFAGFQGLNFPPISVTGISVSVDNHLTEVRSAYSMKTGSAQVRENAFPYAIVSNGRTISGRITYIGPVAPSALVERLAGPSSLASGLFIDYGPFSLSLPEIGWTPSSSEGSVGQFKTRTLEWKMVSESYDAMPFLEYSSRA